MQSLFQKLSGFFLPSSDSRMLLHDHAASDAQSENGIRSMSERHYKEAIGFYNKAIELDSSDPFPYYAKAMAYEALGRYDDAIIAADKAIKRDPNCAIAYNTQAMALFALARYDEALKAVDKAVSLDSEHHEPLHLREKIVEAIERKNK